MIKKEVEYVSESDDEPQQEPVKQPQAPKVTATFLILSEEVCVAGPFLGQLRALAPAPGIKVAFRIVFKIYLTQFKQINQTS